MQHFDKSHLKVLPGLLILMLGLSLSSCDEDRDERMTTVFGRVVDQNQIPVDSIMVELDGMRNLDSEELKFTYTDENGNYEIALEVPDKYISVNVVIPYLPIRNPIFQKKYKIRKIFKDGQGTSSCCISNIGAKVKWDFELAPK